VAEPIQTCGPIAGEQSMSPQRIRRKTKVRPIQVHIEEKDRWAVSGRLGKHLDKMKKAVRNFDDRLAILIDGIDDAANKASVEAIEWMFKTATHQFFFIDLTVEEDSMIRIFIDKNSDSTINIDLYELACNSLEDTDPDEVKRYCEFFRALANRIEGAFEATADGYSVQRRVAP
jgi:hypothetical protein